MNYFIFSLMDSSQSGKKENLSIMMNQSLISAQESLECAICFMYLRDPVLTICGHRFCEKCLSKWLTDHDNRCPIDNNHLGADDIFPDNYTKREIAGISIICPNVGCSTSVPVTDFEDHYEICKFREDKLKDSETCECPYKSVGCNFTTSVPMELSAHFKGSIVKHVQLLLMECNKLDDGFRNCQNHCPHNEGCTQNGESMECFKGKLPFYLNDVYEKLTELDQRTKEYAIQLNNVTTQLNKCLTETNCAKPAALEMSNGLLLWKICKFDEMVKEMKKDSTFALYSPTFYTSELGYRFRMRLVLSNKTQNTLGVLIHVVKGNFDFILKWPFSGEITVSMIHPVDPNLRLKSVMKTNGSEQAFQRPTLDINPRGFGFTKTVTLSELEKHGYLQDNQLIIVVSVKTHNVD